MPFTDKIVQSINTNLMAEIFSKGKLQDSKLFELAYVQKRDANEGADYVLTGFENGGESAVGFSDEYQSVIYHRMLSAVFPPPQQASKAGFSDDTVTLQDEPVNMVLVCYAKRETGIHESTLASWIAEVLNKSYSSSEFTSLGISSVTVSPTSVNFDSASVWTSEYKNANYPFTVEQIFFSINYQIKTSYSKGCFTKCCI